MALHYPHTLVPTCSHSAVSFDQEGREGLIVLSLRLQGLGLEVGE